LSAHIRIFLTTTSLIPTVCPPSILSNDYSGLLTGDVAVQVLGRQLKCKGKVAPVHVIKVNGNGGQAPLTVHLGTRWSLKVIVAEA
jgi:hypothetical protein